MTEAVVASINEHFAGVKDPRIERTKEHPLINILVIAICAAICGSDGWTEIEEFGEAREEWFARFLDMPSGIPSHDTFGRVFARIDPEQFQHGFLSWVQTLSGLIEGVVAIDGKQLRGSKDGVLGKQAISMVSAWADTNGLVLGQRQVAAKSNEITAIPEVLTLLDLHGCIVTLDAIGCQTEIAAQIVDQGGDYVLALKGNQGRLYEETSHLFATLAQKGFAGATYDFCESHDEGHGRVETRQCWVITPQDWPERFPTLADWKGLRSLAMIRSERRLDDKVSRETRYFLSSLDMNAAAILNAKRRHWTIENGLHWILDVAFNEDQSRIRTDHAPANMAVLRHMALNLLKMETTLKRGIKTKRLKAGWSDAYLLKVLHAGFH